MDDVAVEHSSKGDCETNAREEQELRPAHCPAKDTRHWRGFINCGEIVTMGGIGGVYSL